MQFFMILSNKNKYMQIIKQNIQKQLSRKVIKNVITSYNCSQKK